MSFGTFNVTRKTQFSPTKKYAWLKFLRKLRRECMSSSLEIPGLSFDAKGKERTVAKGQKGLQDEIQCRSTAIPILGVIVIAT